MNHPRYIEVIPAVGDVPRLTFNSNTGRITLKIPTNSTPEQTDIFKAIANSVKENAPDSPITQRSSIFLNSENKYMVRLDGLHTFIA